MHQKLIKKTCVLVAICAALPSIALADNISDTNPWKISVGASYNMLKVSDTSGDIGVTSGDSSYLVKNSNIDYQNAWAPNIEFDRDIGAYITLGLAYENLNSKVNATDPIRATGSTYTGSYAADLKINTVLLKTYLKWPEAFSIGSTNTSPFIGLGLGAANLALSDQQTSTISGIALNPLANNSVWNFAFSAEVGAETIWRSNWSLTYGVKYTNYGKFNSNTIATDTAKNITKSVQANVSSFAPFVNLGYRF